MSEKDKNKNSVVGGGASSNTNTNTSSKPLNVHSYMEKRLAQQQKEGVDSTFDRMIHSGSNILEQSGSSIITSNLLPIPNSPAAAGVVDDVPPPPPPLPPPPAATTNNNDQNKNTDSVSKSTIATTSLNINYPNNFTPEKASAKSSMDTPTGVIPFDEPGYLKIVAKASPEETQQMRIQMGNTGIVDLENQDAYPMTPQTVQEEDDEEYSPSTSGGKKLFDKENKMKKKNKGVKTKDKEQRQRPRRGANRNNYCTFRICFIVVLLLIMAAIIIFVTLAVSDYIGGTNKMLPFLPSKGVATMDVTKNTASPVTATPTRNPTANPTDRPTNLPTKKATLAPTTKPTNIPTTATPTISPTVAPTKSPTTRVPTTSPTITPTNQPTSPPTPLAFIVMKEYLEMFSPSNLLNDASTPQGQAYQWLIQVDKTILLPSDSTEGEESSSSQTFLVDSLTQRYAMVTMDFAVHAEKIIESRNLIENDNKLSVSDLKSAAGFAKSLLHECDWYGITCDENRVVTEINWSNQELTGAVTPELLMLDNLKKLDLSSNALFGTLDPFWEMTSLTNLYLQENQFSGTISSNVAEMNNLEMLYLGHNRLTGNVPSQWLGALRYLVLHHNMLTGTLPEGMRLRQVFYLDIGFNQLSGEIPTDFVAATPSVRMIFLDHNRFSGALPNDFSMLGNGRLKQLVMNDNQFTGRIPTNWGTITTLTNMNINNNNFKKLNKNICRMGVFEGGELIELKTDCNVCTCGELCSDTCT